MRVWDPAQRLLHWGLVLAVAFSWVVGEAKLQWHIGFGYAALGIAGARVLWGWLGGPRARFARFVVGPRRLIGYAQAVWRHREPRYLGHNPLGGWMIVALLSCLACVCVSGIMYTTDRFWGLEWVELAHRISAWLLLVLAGVHVAGVVFTGWRQSENLVAAMVSGRKTARSGDADPNG